jgi:PadR family transcriptional regulator PadR
MADPCLAHRQPGRDPKRPPAKGGGSRTLVACVQTAGKRFGDSPGGAPTERRRRILLVAAGAVGHAARAETPGRPNTALAACAKGHMQKARAAERSNLSADWHRPSLRCKLFHGIVPCKAMVDRRGSQLLRGVLDLCLLAVMEDGPAYGYEMTRRLGARGLSIVGEGSIYPLLGRLERDGLVETYRAASDGGPPRKYYRASPQGRDALRSGVAEWRSARDAVDRVLALVQMEVKP